MTLTCSACSAQIPEGNRFCGSCGAPMERPAATEPAVTPTATLAAPASQPAPIQSVVAAPIQSVVTAPVQSVVAAPILPLAEMGSRLGARLLDGLIVFVALIPFALISNVMQASSTPYDSGGAVSAGNGFVRFMLGLIVIVGLLGYEPFFIATRGATPGKSLVHIRVVRLADGRLPGWGPSFIRFLLPWLGSLLCYVGQILIFVSPFFDSTGRRQGWHDKAAGTIVVKDSTTPTASSGPAWFATTPPQATAASEPTENASARPRVCVLCGTAAQPEHAFCQSCGRSLQPFSATAQPATAPSNRRPLLLGLGALGVVILVGGAFALNAMRTPEHISPRGTLAQSAPSDVPPAQPAENPTTAAPPQVTTVMVSSRDDPAQGGTRTGINLQAGQLVTIQATGATTYGNDGVPCSGLPTVDPDGRRWNNNAACPQKFDTAMPVPTAPVGSLIGAVGSGPWYAVGGSASFRAGTSGELRLGYNDAFVTDDSGSYTVSIVVQ